MSKNEYEVGQLNRQRRPMGPPGPGGPMRAGEKPKDFKKAISKLVSYSRKYWTAMIVSFICAIGGSITTLIGPNRLSEITDLISAPLQEAMEKLEQGIMTGIGSIDLDRIVDICTFLVILYVVGSILLFIQGWINATVTQRLTNGLRRGISEKINKLPLRYFDNNTFGNILSRVTNDIDTLGMSLNQSLGQLVTSVAMFVGAIVMMLATNVVMALTAIGSTLIGLILMAIILKTSQKYFKRNQKYLGEINGHVEEIYAGHNIVKAYNGEKEARKVFGELNEKLYDSNWKSQFFSGLMMPLMQFIGNFGYVAVCVVGAVIFKNNPENGFGFIVAFMLYIRLFTQPLAQVAQSATILQSTAAAAERVFEFLEEQEMEDEAQKTEQLLTVHGDVTFDHVSFGYYPDKTIIRDFSADIKAGQKVAIVGPTGAGKTTIVNLLMRFYDVDSGEIRVDGVPTKNLKRENVHDLFCMVLQDTWLFEGTIKENIVYSKEGVTDEEVKNACKAVGLHHFIRTLPHGYDTVLNDNANLSAGQKQLMTIARAMIENSPLLILDEATSSVDTRTEILVQKAMDELMKGRTSFVIAHRLSTIKNADVILVMRDGDIVESGNHEELLQKGGFYAELYNSQFEQAS